MGDFFDELRRRNVFRMAIAYLAASWLLIQLAETLFPIFGLTDMLLRLVVILLAIGLPVVLIFTWVYELTPDGLKLDRNVERSSSRKPHTGQKLDRVIIVMLTLALGYFAIDKFLLDPARMAALEESVAEQVRSEALVDSFGDRSIAVLPFVNMSGDRSNEYFSDGISEELLNLLSKIPKLRVISRSSSFSLKGKDLDVPTIAQQLNVAHVLEGSVRKDGDTVRITAQLIEARSDTHLWSDTYDRELDDIFGIQDEISAAIVDALKAKLALAADAAPQVKFTTNLEAHEAYLRGRFLAAQRTPSSIEGAIREFGKAIELDPGFALAHAEFAISYLLGYLGLAETEAIARATPHVERAMALDPTLAESHAAAGLRSWVQGNPETALGSFEEAVRINPNYSEAFVWIGMILEIQLGRYQESFAAQRSAVQLDPLSIPANGNYLAALISRGRLEEADRQLDKLASVSPADYARIQGFRSSLGGNWANIALGGLQALHSDPQNDALKYGLALSFALLGLEAEAFDVWTPPHPYMVAILGKRQAAVSAAKAGLADDPNSPEARDQLGFALAAAGDYAEARPIMEELWNRHSNRASNTLGGDFAAALSAIRRSTGADVRVDELATPMREDVRRRREAGITTVTWNASNDYDSGIVDYIAGEKEKGLELIARAVADGFFIMPNEAYLQELYDDPGFAAIRDIQESRRDRERSRFLAIVCNDNPYADVWQPNEATCERFAAENGN